jgi:hypothetical protein
VYTSTPGEKDPGVLVPQLEQTVFSKLHNCTTSYPLTEGITVRAWLPKLTPEQGLVGRPEPEGIAAPTIFREILQLELNEVGQFAQSCTPPQSLYNLTVTKYIPGVPDIH